MNSTKIINTDLNGVIILDKPKDFTSNDCLSVIKKSLHVKKIGHTGTLDENATGVLACLVGTATKCQEYLMKTGSKIYEAELIFGIKTDTEDFTGTVTSYNEDLGISFDDLKNAVESFIGEYSQVPPMYSAKKVNGKKLINLARKGIDIERKPSLVHIYKIDVSDLMKDSILIENKDYNIIKANLQVECSKGTYIRTLCKDIGEKLKVNSCMGNLRRIRTSFFDITDSITLEELKTEAEKNDYSFIKPCYYTEDENVLTFGKFETLHIGHRLLIDRVVSEAKNNKLKSSVMIVGDNSDNLIITKEQRLSKIKFWGVDNVIYFPLNELNSHIDANHFIKEIIVKQLNTKILVVGSDCRFGYQGKGDISLLKDVLKEYGVKLIVIDKLKVENSAEVISSTFIKLEYQKGNIDLVNKLLGK